MSPSNMKQGPGGYKPSVFMNDYSLEEYNYIAGVDESVSEKHLINFSRRHMFGYTELSDGITFRKGSIGTDGLGYGVLPVSLIGLTGLLNRPIGVFPSSFSNKNFIDACYKLTGGTTFAGLITLKDLTSNTTVLSYTGSGLTTAPFPFLACVAHLNGYDCYTDGIILNKLSNSTAAANSDIIVDVSQFTITPVAYVAGALNGYYAYAITLVDANNNETNPSYFNGDNTGATNFAQAVNNTIKMTINIGAIYDTAPQKFTSIRVYRTLTNASAPTASQNPTMYLVNTIPIVVGTASYSFSDNNTDALISTGINTNTGLTSVILFNVTYNQQLIPFSGGQPKFLTAWNNRLFIANVPGTGNYPSRIWWSDFTDNTAQANGNICSWNKNNFIDVDANDGFPIIGLFPGLGGRLFVFKENGTWIISQTGSTTTNTQGQVIAPFRPDKINNEFGMYHHSVAEVGGSVYGRVRDGIAIFNGSTYKLISNQVRKTLESCIIPEGDSGVYDIGTGRYYLSVCDSRLSGSYNMNFNGNPSLLLAYRNTVLVFNAPNNTWEIHKNQFIQTFGKVKDTYGKQTIIGQSINQNNFIMLNGQISGFPYADTWTGITETTLTSTFNLNTFHIGKRIYISHVVDANSNFSFVDYSAKITGVSGSTVTVDTPLPTNATNTFFVYVDYSYGTVQSSNSTTITDANNNFTTGKEMTQYSFALIDPANVANDTYGIIASNTATVITPTTGTWTGFANYNYVIMPYQYVNTLSNTVNYQTPRWTYLTPPIGDIHGGQKKKKFNKFKLEIKGTGTLRIKSYKNGDLTTVDQTIYWTIPAPAANAFQPYYINLQGSVCNYMRFEISMVRGAGSFEITGYGARYRNLGEMRNSA